MVVIKVFIKKGSNLIKLYNFNLNYCISNIWLILDYKYIHYLILILVQCKRKIEEFLKNLLYSN